MVKLLLGTLLTCSRTRQAACCPRSPTSDIGVHRNWLCKGTWQGREVAVGAAAWRSCLAEGKEGPSGTRQGSDGVVTPETLYSQACSVTLPDNSEQMTGLAMKQVAWPPCSGQEGIS